MGEFPRTLLLHTVTVEPALPGGGTGPAEPLPCVVDEQRGVGGKPGQDLTTTFTVFIRTDAVCPAGSVITFNDGRKGFATAATRYDGGGLPTPDHIEVSVAVSQFVASTLITIMRGTAVDEYGDVLDANTVIATGVPASVAVSSSAEVSPEEGREYVVSQATARVGPDVDVRVGDRIRDNATGYVFVVRAVTPGPVPALNAPTALVLKLIQA